jgi:LCP family protein required for cell wall assembly
MWSGIGVLIAIIVLLCGAVGYSMYRNDQIHHIPVRNLNTTQSNGIQDILLIGSTSRCALKVQNAAFGTCAQGVTGVNSDVIMVLRLDPKTHRVALLSFPRDTFLPNARPDQTNRIDSALAYGPSQLVNAIEQDFGIPINHFVELNFDSFQGVVNALGGIDMYFPDPLKDAYSTLNIKRTGCIHLSGFEALAVVRARHLQYEVDGKWYYDGSGDIGRIERDHEFLRVLAGALAKRSLGNPIVDNDLFGAISPQLTVDNGFSLHDIVNLVLTYHHIDAAAVPQLTLPVRIDPSSTYRYEGYNYGYIVFPSEPQDQLTIAQFMKASMPGHALSPKKVTVFIEGGIGSSSATKATSAKLQGLGFKIIGSSEVSPVGPVAETDVLYTPGHLAEGERVLDSLAGAVALGEQKKSNGAEVTVVTGSTFSVRDATSTTTRVTSNASLTHTRTNSALANDSASAELVAMIESAVLRSAITQNLEPSTSSHQTLAPYDPRACPIKRHLKKVAKKTKTS